MAYINEQRIQGFLTEDAQFKGSGANRIATLKVRTIIFAKNGEFPTDHVVQVENPIYLSVLEKHGKKHRWITALGTHVALSSGGTAILVTPYFGQLAVVNFGVPDQKQPDTTANGAATQNSGQAPASGAAAKSGGGLGNLPASSADGSSDDDGDSGSYGGSSGSGGDDTGDQIPF